MHAPDCISSYLRLYGSTLGERVLSQFPPLHNPGDPVSHCLHQLKRRPFPAQTLAILGIVKRFQEARCAAAIAECGTGKTLISFGSVFTAECGSEFADCLDQTMGIFLLEHFKNLCVYPSDKLTTHFSSRLRFSAVYSAASSVPVYGVRKG